MPDITALKKQLRQQLSQQRQQLNPTLRLQYSARIISKLQQHLTSLYAQQTPLQLLVYKALPVEVDTNTLFAAQGYTTFAPRMLAHNQLEWVEVNPQTKWRTVAFGVQEPIHGNLWQAGAQTTVLICPLLGFDHLGNRLGMGKGYFDRWLEQHAIYLEQQIGLAFSCQMLPKVPTEPHDAPLSTIISEHEVMLCPIR